MFHRSTVEVQYQKDLARIRAEVLQAGVCQQVGSGCWQTPSFVKPHARIRAEVDLCVRIENRGFLRLVRRTVCVS